MLEFHSLTVQEHLREAEDAIRLRLAVPPQAREAFHSVPGQHITVRLLVNERPVRRTYTVISPPGSTAVDIAVRVQPGGRVSQTLAREVRSGMQLEVLPPSGRFHLPVPPPGPAHYLALACGSGVTPIYALIRQLLESAPEAHALVFIGNQTLARTMLLEDWLALKDRYLGRLALHFVMSREPQEVAWLNGRLNAEWLARICGRLFDPRSLEAVLLCGPGNMIAECTTALTARGVAPERIHSERFSLESRARVAAEPPAPAQQAGNDATEVTVVMDGRRRSFSMPRDGTRILEAAERSGLVLPYSCRDGICSTCRVKVLEGEVALGEQYALEPWELAAGFTLACQARPRSPRLTLSYDER